MEHPTPHTRAVTRGLYQGRCCVVSFVFRVAHGHTHHRVWKGEHHTHHRVWKGEHVFFFLEL